MRPALLLFNVVCVKLIDSDAEFFRAAANLVERQQPVIIVEGGVLQPLGHYRSRQLLKFHHELQVRYPLQKHITHELHRRRLRFHRFDVFRVGADRFGSIRPIDREPRCSFCDGGSQIKQREILALGNSFQKMRQGVDFALEGHGEHLLLACVSHLREIVCAAGDILIQLRHLGFFALVHKESI